MFYIKYIWQIGILKLLFLVSCSKYLILTRMFLVKTNPNFTANGFVSILHLL